MASIAALHGPGFCYEDAVAELFSAPSSAVIYVVRQAGPKFERCRRSANRVSNRPCGRQART